MTDSKRKNAPPAPPARAGKSGKGASPIGDQTIADMRKAFKQKSLPRKDPLSASEAFIAGKIEMVRGDPNMTDAEKARAIADLEARLREL